MNKKLIALFLPILLVGCNPSVSSQNSNDVNTNSSSVVNVKTYNITIVENPNCKITTSKDKASRNETIEVYVTDIKEGYTKELIKLADFYNTNLDYIVGRTNKKERID